MPQRSSSCQNSLTVDGLAVIDKITVKIRYLQSNLLFKYGATRLLKISGSVFILHNLYHLYCSDTNGANSGIDSMPFCHETAWARILVQVTIYCRLQIDIFLAASLDTARPSGIASLAVEDADWSKWPSRPIRSLRYIVICTRIRALMRSY